MVVRWEVGFAYIGKGISGPHAIYASEYDKAVDSFVCHNNWNKKLPKQLNIHRSRVYAVDYVSIDQGWLEDNNRQQKQTTESEIVEVGRQRINSVTSNQSIRSYDSTGNIFFK